MDYGEGKNNHYPLFYGAFDRFFNERFQELNEGEVIYEHELNIFEWFR